MTDAVSIENAVVCYRKKRVLHDLTLHVQRGELLGLFGPNGSGKTTLLRLIRGLITPVSGSVNTSSNARIAYMPQIVNVDPRMPVTAFEVVMMGRYGRIGLFRRPQTEDYAAAEHAMDSVNAGHLAKRPFGQLSGGEQQRVMIARALAQDPEILLLDEPTNSLDWESQGRVRELIRTVHEECCLTTIVVSHDVLMLAELSDRIVHIEGGRIIGERSPSEFRDALTGCGL